MEPNKPFLYDKPDVNAIDELHIEIQKIVYWIGQNKTVLEAGCHTGHLAFWLKRNGCRVTGIELNDLALEKAKPHLEQGINGDLEDPETWLAVKEKSFDVITFIHVLEHLRDAETAIKRGMERLKEDGIMVIGLPNISNAKDRFEMLRGRFEYTDIGVMDRTHLRFFNHKTAREMIEGAGLEIIDYYSPWQVNPVKVFFDHIPIFWRLSRFFHPNKPPMFPKFSRNLTDVVMLFKCRKR